MNTARSPFLTLTLIAMVLFLVFQLREARQARVAQPTLPAAAARPQAADTRAEPSVRTPRETEATVVYKRVSPSVVAVANNALVRRGLFFDFQIYECRKGPAPASCGTRRATSSATTMWCTRPAR
jgi:hypothetical protein